jgi:hypothetical protein
MPDLLTQFGCGPIPFYGHPEQHLEAILTDVRQIVGSA